MIDIAQAADAARVSLCASTGISETSDPFGFVVTVTCIDKNGNPRWEEVNHNVVTTAGKTDMLQQYFLGSSYVASWYCGLKNAGTAVVGDTMASHAGWTENITYSQPARPTVVFAAASAASINNSASRAAFSMTGTTTVAGCFMCNNSTISGTSGVLYNAIDFAQARNVLNGDTITVQLTISQS